MSHEIMLKAENLSVNYGHIEALIDVSLEVRKGEICSIIGANGAGKSTFLKAVSALVKPIKGTIEFEGEPLPKKAYKVVQKGVIHVPEGRRTFSGLTVEDNLLVGAYCSDKQKIKEDLESQYELFPILKERRTQFAGTLSGGEQQMLAVCRGLMSHPRILLLDEPSMGLAPIIVEQIYSIIQMIRERCITILLVEQNAKKALSICDYAYVLENGRIKLKGTGRELMDSDDVRKAYLGG